MVALNPYPRGFVLHDARPNLTLPTGWSEVVLPRTTWRFEHDPAENVDLARTSDGMGWILVYGLCLYCGADQRPLTPAERLVEASERGTNAFLDELDLVGGRHLVIRASPEGLELYQDATGMRSVYFSPEAGLVSSHVHLINDLVPHEKRSKAQGSGGALSGWDRTPFLGVTALIPNHVLRLADWGCVRFFPRGQNRYQKFSHQERLDTFRAIWDRQMSELKSLGSRLVMSLTGGADSRTSLALSMAHLDDIEMFTYTVPRVGTSRWSQMMDLDRRLVEEIKALVPVNHRYFVFGEQSHPEQEMISQRLAKNTHSSHGRWLVPHYAAAFPTDDVIHLRGNAYEIGRAYWGTDSKNDNMASLQKLYLSRTQKDKGSVPFQRRVEDFHRGVHDWQYDTQMFGFHLFDIFYWEIRSGRWLAEILNETDIAFNTCVPMNCRAMIEVSLAYPVKDRRSGYFFAELINEGHAVLNFPGKNDVRNLYEQYRDEARAPSAVLASGESAAELIPGLQVSRPDGSLGTTASTDDSLWVPASEFLPGTECARVFQPATGPSDLSFTLDSPYMYSKARGTWSYRVLVDDQVYLEWDGATRRRPVHVTVAGLTPEHTVTIQARVRVDQHGAQSWEVASRAMVMDAVFTSTTLASADTRPVVASDIPGAASSY